MSFVNYQLDSISYQKQGKHVKEIGIILVENSLTGIKVKHKNTLNIIIKPLALFLRS